MIDWQRKYEIFKGFLFRLINKEFLIFLVFLAVSTAFWFLTTLNDVYEREIPLQLKLTEVPENIIVTEKLPDSIRVTMRDKGYNLLNFIVNGDRQAISLPFALYTDNKGKGQVTPADIQKILRLRLSETTVITSIKADHWDFYYNHGKKKIVPVLLDGSIITKANYYVTRSSFTPDSVAVYASDEALDTIRAIYTEPLHLEGVYESTRMDVKLHHIHGAKIMPMEVSLGIVTDQLTEVVVSVPIRTINVPENESLKTFPARIDVRVAVGVKRSASIKPELFNVVVDYNDLPAATGQKLPVRIISQPKGIVKATPINSTVDYLIEK